jgi:hypothetical protein
MCSIPNTQASYGTGANIEIANPVMDEQAYACSSVIGRFIPKADPEKAKLTRWQKLKSTHKNLLLLMCTLAGLTFTINLVTAVIFRYKYDAQGGYEGELFRGDCVFAADLDLGLHIAINVLSTMLLSASNLSMQLLLAPTRGMIEKAHKKDTWLDIGIPSVRNFRHVELRKKVLWVILAISSLPLHFL